MSLRLKILPHCKRSCHRDTPTFNLLVMIEHPVSMKDRLSLRPITSLISRDVIPEEANLEAAHSRLLIGSNPKVFRREAKRGHIMHMSGAFFPFFFRRPYTRVICGIFRTCFLVFFFWTRIKKIFENSVADSFVGRSAVIRQTLRLKILRMLFWVSPETQIVRFPTFILFFSNESDCVWCHLRRRSCLRT